jgi:phosphoglucomutase
MMENFRNNPPAALNGSEVVMLKDYELQVCRDLVKRNETSTGLPRSNVLQFILADGSIISARPSGTEPKIKFYFSVHTPLEQASSYLEKDRELGEKIKGIIRELKI